MMGGLKLNNIVSLHEERELVYMNTDEFLKNETVSFQNIILTLTINNELLKFDCAKICYKEWVSKGTAVANHIRHIVLPVKGTLRDSTSLDLIKRYIKKNIVNGVSQSTVKNSLFQLAGLFKELDKLNVEKDWSDKNSQLNLYKKYSEKLYLNFQLALKDDKKTNIFYNHLKLFIFFFF